MFLIPKFQYAVRKTRHKGRGVFARADIAPGTIIGDYLGKIIRPSEDDENAQGGIYAMWYNDRAMILADPERDGIHLINHSCASNCGIYPYQGHELYFALRRILKKEEIAVSYIEEIYENCASCQKHACFCKTPVCRGTLHSREDEVKRWDAFAKRKLAPYARALPAPYGNQLLPLAQYPSRIKDYPVYGLFGSLAAPPLILKNRALPSLSLLRRSIRATGKRLSFPHIGLIVYGIDNGMIVAFKKTS